MIKKKLFWIIAGLVAVAVIVLVLILPDANSVSSIQTRAEPLPQGKNILASAWPEKQGVQKGDAFYYVVEVVYNTDFVSGIDKVTLDENVNLNPFEVKSITERTFKLDSQTRVYQRLYLVQFVNGNVERIYDFPSIVVKYKLKSTNGYAETPAMPESVYVAPRLPSSGAVIISGLNAGTYSLQPVEGNIKKTGVNTSSWILWIAGGLLLVFLVVNLVTRVIPQWKEDERLQRGRHMSELLRETYGSLRKNLDSGAKTSRLLHQMDYIQRIVLSPEERIGLLQELDLEQVPCEIKPTVISLFEKCAKSYENEDITQQEVKEAAKQLEEVLRYYYEEDMEEWTV
ncbi:MAG: hypothetical protein PHF74_05180 [Dehalococcoidales bacterium]|nr:hypothetical protein [Dehalococcoidales bacterium]